MDDYSLSSLVESKNEWCARLVTILTPAVIVGLKSIFEEAVKLCNDNEEDDKYLMTFQTFLSRVPKWNNEIIENEKKRITEVSSCKYLEDLITCVHIIHLKSLTCIRVGQQQKKIDIDVPSLDKFIHKIYITIARKVYTNVYLFEKDIPPLSIQKHNRELEILIKESILFSIRENMPVEDILRAYISETIEENVEVKEEIIETPKKEADKVKDDENNKDKTMESKPEDDNKAVIKYPLAEKVEDEVKKELKEENKEVEAINTILKETPILPTPVENVETGNSELTFNDTDNAINTEGKESTIEAPKNIERLEQIASEANIKRKLEEEEDEDDLPLKIGDEVKLEIGSINDLNRPVDLNPPPQIEVETLI